MKTNQNFGEFNESKIVSTYIDNFVRFKIFPLAAAAYGSDKNILDCLTQIYPDFQFIRNWVVKCQFTDPYCSAFIAVSFTDAAIVLAFRGTDTFLQLQHEISDTLFRKKVPSVFGYGHVASYFDDVFNQLDKKGVTEEIFYLIRKYPAYELWGCRGIRRDIKRYYPIISPHRPQMTTQKVCLACLSYPLFFRD
uniref:Uncharacterized protein n=1 Tax=Meloidogyne incognita TaxID=6306 RepID=A0A914N9A8_MELIC